MNQVRSLLVVWGLCFLAFCLGSPVFAATTAPTVTSVKVSNIPAVTYDAYDDPKNDAICSVYYSDGTVGNCKNLLTAQAGSLQSTDKYRQICYSYSQGGKSASACTNRYYASSVTVAGSTAIHTGDHMYYQCKVNYKNGNVVVFQGDGGEVWSSAPYNFMGDDFKNTGYINEDYGNRVVRISRTNEFYAGDLSTRTYTVTCNPSLYYYTVYGESENKVTGSLSVKNIGVGYTYMTATGMFYDQNGAYNTMTIPSKDGKVFPKSFISGLFYDFTPVLHYTDGTEKAVAKADDVHWSSSVNTNNKMPTSGSDYLAPMSANTVTISDDLFGWSPSVQASRDAGSTISNYDAPLKTHWVQAVELHGPSLQEDPQITAKPKETVAYTAWVRWSDENKGSTSSADREQSQPQDWTKLVQWSGTYATGVPGKYYFNVYGLGVKTDVTAVFVADGSSVLSGTIKPSVTVTINGCDSDTLSYGCGIPQTDWTTNPQSLMGNVYDGFTGLSASVIQNSNFLPPPSAMGETKWTDKNHPYYYGYQFPVSGVNGGVKNK